PAPRADAAPRPSPRPRPRHRPRSGGGLEDDPGGAPRVLARAGGAAPADRREQDRSRWRRAPVEARGGHGPSPPAPRVPAGRPDRAGARGAPRRPRGCAPDRRGPRGGSAGVTRRRLRRVVVKVGSGLIADPTAGPDRARIEPLAAEIAAVMAGGV